MQRDAIVVDEGQEIEAGIIVENYVIVLLDKVSAVV
jgi:hypothetical protein